MIWPVQRLSRFGYRFVQNAAGSREIWKSEQLGRWTTIPNHPGDIPEGTLRAILRQAGVTPEQFLSVDD